MAGGNMNIVSFGGDGDRKPPPAPPRNKARPMARHSVSSNSNGNGSGNDSENSGIVSLGNNSFGFNFDAEETPPQSDKGGNNSDGSDSPPPPRQGTSVPQPQQQQQSLPPPPPPPPQQPETADDPVATAAHAAAANEAVASLHAIANENKTKGEPSQVPSSMGDDQGASDASQQMSMNIVSGSGSSVMSSEGGRPKKKQKKVLDESKREERNAREKERSFRISKQINELRNLLSSGGVIVPKGTKSSVLTEAANYIRMLQQHQYRSEIDRQQLVQQIQMIGGGALGPQAAQTIRHVAAQNGVWSLGNFGGVPPKSAMQFYPDAAAPAATETTPPPGAPDAPLQTKIDDPEYRFIFNSCSVGMAVASMGGAFIDCNELFCQLSNYTKQEVCSLTIFNLTSRQDLQPAFDLISEMISPPADGNGSVAVAKPCVLRGSMNNRDDIGLSVALIKGDDGIAKCFCVTLIHNPASPYDTAKPVPATADMIMQSQQVAGAVAVGSGKQAAALPKDGNADNKALDSAPTTQQDSVLSPLHLCIMGM
eukprot:CAMPEP_0194032250 /NCGR_PEP_ID=MMETSP0009_2-20130614/5232_1 /TAXON_ID=210454 /ORGANISM="Grammatophora oceanica, Strain CCMP 410" /LENGTH=537 /DNA_ID=CAMNT_0038672633 /DNA_START=334 /DNA_END=1948 /DNA_ORIENTATION=+